jgi:hypothetical protein
MQTANGGDVLQAATPRKLKRGPEGWSLEVERLVRVSGTLYRPSSATMRGREAVLRQLLATAPALAESAEVLMDDAASGDAVFEAVGTAWREGEVDLSSPLEAAERSALLEPRVLELEAQVQGLLAANRQLETRLDALEARLASGATVAPDLPPREREAAPPLDHEESPPPADESVPSGPPPGPVPMPSGEDEDDAPPPAPDLAAAPDGPTPVPFEAEEGDAEEAPEAADAAEEVEEEEEERTEDAEAATLEGAGVDEAQEREEPPPPADFDALQLPRAGAYAEGLQTLLGESVGLSLDRAEAPRIDEGYWVCPLIDDGDRTVGAMVADVRTVIRHGGLLVMLGEDAIADMLRGSDPSEDAVESMSEIFNVQSACINTLGGNDHVRVTDLRPFDPDEDGWMRGPRERVDFVDSEGDRTVLLAR